MNHLNTEQNISRMAMGVWKLNISGFKKNGKKHQHTVSKFSGRYTVKPPSEGWPEGYPELNGWIPEKGK